LAHVLAVPEIYSDQILDALRCLAVAGVAVIAYRTAKDAANTHGRWWSIWRSAAWCGAIAFLAAMLLGKPSCEDGGDRMVGSCELEAESGFEATTDQRAAQFLFFILILGVPALSGAMNGQSYSRPPAASKIG
jgi:hypothetical protein